MKFEWDKQKSIANQKKHGISFSDALTVFLDNHVNVELDSEDEQRFAAIGPIRKKFFTIVYTKRKGKIRLISARRSRKDEEQYHAKIFKNR